MDISSNNVDQGYLKIQVTTNNNLPIDGVSIEIRNSSEPNKTIETLITNSSGQTDSISLPAPPVEYSMTPTDNQPYSEYTLKITSDIYDDEIVSGVQIFPNEIGLQTFRLNPKKSQAIYNPTAIAAHTLWEYYPPKIAEYETKPLNESGEIVLRNVVIPETIVVHDGPPADKDAPNYYVPYTDYIKNVACCEIYSTWPTSTITANILAIMSFTLNRVYTEWYRNKGYNFTITSSTAYDHKWIKNKTIYNSISQIVDNIFNSYLARPNVKQPILTQYCDGKRVTCPNWMSQWGSKYLGDDGLSASDILRYYYGNSIYINQAKQISGIPVSFPGYNLSDGSNGDAVTQIQEQLSKISNAYPAIAKIAVDGIYGTNTKRAVEQFQKIFNLPISGIVDFPTWYKISQIYVGVTKIAENLQ